MHDDAAVTIELGVGDDIAGDEAVAVAGRAAADVAAMFDLPVPPPGAKVTATGSDRLAVTVNGRPCRIAPANQLMRYRGSAADRIGDVVHAHAAHLITDEVAAALWTQLGGAAGPPPWFGDLARDLVRAGVRPGRLAKTAVLDDGADPRALFEDAIRLAAGPVRILVDGQAYEQLRADWRPVMEGVSFFASTMYEELGILVGGPRYEVDPQLPAEHFAVAFNDARTRPLPALAPDRILINDTVERLRWMKVEAEEAANPDTGQPAAVGAASDRELLESAGLTVWTPVGYLLLVAAALVRRQAPALLHRDLLAYALTELGTGFPLLAPAIERIGGAGRVTRLLRRLLAEGVSIRDLPTAVAAMHGLDPLPDQAPGFVVVPAGRGRPYVAPGPEIGDAEEAGLAEAARIALCRQISTKAARSTSTLVCYVISPEIEQRLRDPAPLSAGERASVLDMLDREIGHLPRGTAIPFILTRTVIRARLRSLIAVEHPGVGVLAYEELLPHFNVQPIARLSLT